VSASASAVDRAGDFRESAQAGDREARACE
jgi:hypothetical protein